MFLSRFSSIILNNCPKTVICRSHVHETRMTILNKQTSKQLKLIDAMSKHEMGILIIAIIRHCNTVRTIDRVRRLNISSENVSMNGNVERKSIWI